MRKHSSVESRFFKAHLDGQNKQEVDAELQQKIEDKINSMKYFVTRRLFAHTVCVCVCARACECKCVSVSVLLFQNV